MENYYFLENGKAERKDYSFGIIDNKNRECGYRTVITVATVKPYEPKKANNYLEGVNVGDSVYILFTHPTRDGELFGALHGDRVFNSLKAAQSAEKRKAADAEKRLLKKAQGLGC